MQRLSRTLLVAVCLASLAAGQAAGHNAALAPEQYVRFLADCSDDWGGHSALRDGHDLVALDMTERWIPTANEAAFFTLLTLGFGFAETGSQGGPLRIDVELTRGDQPLRVRLATDDNKAFRAESAPGFLLPDILLPPRPSLLPSGTQDGSRFLLEFGFHYSSLGLQEGDQITAAKVQAYARQDRGDFMPGGYYLLGVASGGDRECPQSGHQGSGDPGTLYVRRDYTLRGTETPFVTILLNTDGVAVSGNQTGFAQLALENKLSKQEQSFHVRALLGPTWHVDVQPATKKTAASGSSEFEITLRAKGPAANNESLQLVIDSDQGAHATRSLPVYWYPPGVEPSIPAPRTTTPSPGAGAFLASLVLLAFALSRRQPD